MAREIEMSLKSSASFGWLLLMLFSLFFFLGSGGGFIGYVR